MTQGRKLWAGCGGGGNHHSLSNDSSLWRDGTRVLTRTMKKIKSKPRGLKGKVRDRTRSMLKRVLANALSTRLLRPPGEETVHQQRPDESRARWLPMRDFIRAKTRKRAGG